MDKDITDQVKVGLIDGECLPLEVCACGLKFDNWECVLSIERDAFFQCDCGRKLYFSNKITVYEIVESRESK